MGWGSLQTPQVTEFNQNLWLADPEESFFTRYVLTGSINYEQKGTKALLLHVDGCLKPILIKHIEEGVIYIGLTN